MARELEQKDGGGGEEKERESLVDKIRYAADDDKIR